MTTSESPKAAPKTRKPRATNAEKVLAEAREEMIREPLFALMYAALLPLLTNLGMVGELRANETFPAKTTLAFHYMANSGSLELEFDGSYWRAILRDEKGNGLTNISKRDLLTNMLELPNESPTDLRAILEMVKFRLPQVLALIGPVKGAQYRAKAPVGYTPEGPEGLDVREPNR